MTISRNLLIMGKPGSGKGTQASLLANRLGIPHISTGDIFRREMELKTPLGLSITESMNAGKYTSDEITNAVIEKRLAEDDAQAGFLLDGYPRTLAQVEFLDSIGIEVHAVIELFLDTEDAVNRLVLRGREQSRGDDDEFVIRSRMQTYDDTVLPVLAAYKERNLVRTVSAVGKVADINQSLCRELV